MNVEKETNLFCADAIDWLRQEYSSRHDRNPSFSLRAFARYLGIAPGPLSEILTKKRSLTPRQGERIARKLGLSPEERKRFIDSLSLNSTKKPESAPDHAVKRLHSDKFALVADWYHLAILNLFDTAGARGEENWIARRLGISIVECRAALERLERLSLCQKIGAFWRLVRGSATVTQSGVPSEAIRKYHRQNLERAIAAVDNVPMDLRDFSSITMAVDVRKLNVAKRRIKRFRRSLAKFLESDGNKTEVYQLNIQLLPVTKKGEEE
jgi:uncharacterized protein (TIGR02147 family)